MLEEIKDSVSIEEPLEMILKFMKSGKAIINTLEPIDISKYTKETIDQLVDETYERMSKVYKELTDAVLTTVSIDSDSTDKLLADSIKNSIFKLFLSAHYSSALQRNNFFRYWNRQEYCQLSHDWPYYWYW